MDLVNELARGNIRALSRAISLIEDQAQGYQELLGELYRNAGRSIRVGLTGPPGAGKSTLVNALTHEFLRESKKVGIIAVDPTSPFTGGALLGDRVRMNEFPTDGSVYFRSMATRGATGGLAAATGNVSVALDAFGYDVTLIETVGVGQMELDVIDACDTVVVVVTPESGDAVQTMKAGLMEIADIFCVNKADRPGVERVVFELEQAMDIRKRDPDAWNVPVLAAEAVNRKNVDKLYATLLDHIKFVRENGSFQAHRRAQLKKSLLSLLQRRVNCVIRQRLERITDLDKIVDDIQQGKTDPYSAATELLSLPDLQGLQS